MRARLIGAKHSQRSGSGDCGRSRSPTTSMAPPLADARRARPRHSPSRPLNSSDGVARAAAAARGADSARARSSSGISRRRREPRRHRGGLGDFTAARRCLGPDDRTVQHRRGPRISPRLTPRPRPCCNPCRNRRMHVPLTTARQRSQPRDRRPTSARDGWIDRLLPAAARPYARLTRLDRPIGTWLLLFPCWWGCSWRSRATGIWLADAVAVLDLSCSLFCSPSARVVMRGAGCTYNDIVDRDFDAKVARTALRPIPSGQVTRAPGRRLPGRAAARRPAHPADLQPLHDPAGRAVAARSSSPIR